MLSFESLLCEPEDRAGSFACAPPAARRGWRFMDEARMAPGQGVDLVVHLGEHRLERGKLAEATELYTPCSSARRTTRAPANGKRPPSAAWRSSATAPGSSPSSSASRPPWSTP
ncbi:hypothetical protein [Nannocystis exedens]|uniref:hypothetical protein n=1 Tax=Nannocystis exedens TaxID=54 RepID=UPI0011802F93|nr:hypothetical protein [Nannocystis exedens]